MAYLSFSASCVLIYFTDSIYNILFLSTSFGFLLTVLNTLPYKMIFEFNQSMSDSQFRGIGVDCSVLSCSFFLAQMIVAVSMSYLIYLMDNRVILVTGAMFSALGFFLNSYFLYYP